MALVAEAATQCHEGRRLAAPERPARGAEAPVEQIGMRRKPGLTAKGADEVAGSSPKRFKTNGNIEPDNVPHSTTPTSEMPTVAAMSGQWGP